MKTLILRVLVTACVIGLGVQSVNAQSQKPAAKLEFDAASIKVDKEPLGPGSLGMHGGPGTDDPGRITWRGLRLRGLIGQAYDIEGSKITGHTADLDVDRFILTATIPRGATREQFRVMLQNLLAERFHLALHHENRMSSGYELILASGGPKFRKWIPDPNVPPRMLGKHLEAGQSGFDWKVTRTPPMIHVTSRESMAEFADDLSALWFMGENTRGDADRDQPVSDGFRSGSPEPMPAFVDRTGLVGEHELVFDYEGAMVPGRASAGGPTLTSVLEKQLGLKLSKAGRVPVDILVIDHADRVPVEN